MHARSVSQHKKRIRERGFYRCYLASLGWSHDITERDDTCVAHMVLQLINMRKHNSVCMTMLYSNRLSSFEGVASHKLET
eukprot:3857273-Amphidinium_carterae.1